MDIKINQVQQSLIENFVCGSDELDLYALVKKLSDISIYTLLQKIKECGETHGVSVVTVFHLRQFEDVWHKLREQVPAEELMAAVCSQMSMLQTGSIVGKYCNDESIYASFSQLADVVMFGDSITEAPPWHEIFTDVKIVNRGIGGDITRGMLARIDTVLRLKPKKVFVMAGINDLNLGYDIDGILQRYENIVGAFADNGVEVFVQSTLYVGERLKAVNKSVELLNNKLSIMCQCRDITFIDLATVLCPGGILPITHSYDDLHLNGVAYEKWCRLIYDYVH